MVHRKAVLRFESDDSLKYYGATNACATYASPLARDKGGGYVIGCAGGLGGRLIKPGEDGNAEWAREYASYPAGIVSLERGFYHVGFQSSGFAAARVGPKGQFENVRDPGFINDDLGVNLPEVALDPTLLDPSSIPAYFPSFDAVLAAGGTTVRVDDLIETRPVTLVAGLTILPTYPVTVTKSGTGSITSSPAGIDCGGVCTDLFAAGTTVTLFAVPPPGSVILWSGACSGSGSSCRLTDIPGPRNVTATFKKTYGLTLTNPGRGSGKVVVQVQYDFKDCALAGGQSCSYSMVENVPIKLTALQDAGNTFLGWSGACTGMASCVINMTEAKNVQARFEPGVPLFITKTGSGSGTVSSDPAGIDCGPTCSNGFVQGSTVTLSATASSGSQFAGWSGACTGTGTCAVVAGSQATVSAQFDLLPPRVGKHLTVRKDGTGSGKVVSLHSRESINCGSVCAADLPTGTKVMLHVQHEPDSRFVGWKGDCSGQSTCTLWMNENQEAVAIFEKKR